MRADNPYAGPVWLGYLFSFMALVTLILGLGNTPLVDWSTIDYVLGAVVVIFGVGMFVASKTGRFTLMGDRVSGRQGRLISAIGLVFAGIVVGYGFGSGSSFVNIITTGIFMALTVMFLVSYVITTRKVDEGDWGQLIG